MQGRPALDVEITEAYNPLEAGLYHAVSVNKGAGLLVTCLQWFIRLFWTADTLVAVWSLAACARGCLQAAACPRDPVLPINVPFE